LRNGCEVAVKKKKFGFELKFYVGNPDIDPVAVIIQAERYKGYRPGYLSYPIVMDSEFKN